MKLFKITDEYFKGLTEMFFSDSLLSSRMTKRTKNSSRSYLIHKHSFNMPACAFLMYELLFDINLGYVRTLCKKLLRYFQLFLFS